MARIDNYAPYGNQDFWAEAGPVVREIVTRLEPATEMLALHWLSAITQLARWVSTVAGHPVTAQTLFEPSIVQRYVAAGGRSASAAADLHARLRGYGTRLSRPSARSRKPHPQLTATPYTRRELATFASWCTTRSTPLRRRNATVHLALGLGAGMRSAEIEAARVSNFTERDGVLVVATRGREIPMLQRQADLVRKILPGLATHELLIKMETRTSERTYLAVRSGPGKGPVSERLRATWIVAHLQAGTPLKELQLAAGLQDRTSLARYLVHVRPTEDVHTRMANVVAGT